MEPSARHGSQGKNLSLTYLLQALQTATPILLVLKCCFLQLRLFYSMWGVTNKDKDVPLIVAQYVNTPSDLDSVLRQRSNSRLPQFSDLFGFALLRCFPQLTVRD